MKLDLVREYYASFRQREWGRLEGPEGAIEFAVNSHYIERHLPPEVRVLDLGGGPGRYAIWLAERGHRVVLADLSPDLLEEARTRIAHSDVGARIEEIVETDARDLSAWDEGGFDAVLSLGPFYHLVEDADRHTAAEELRRVIRPGGLAFVAFMPRYAFLRRTIALQDERRHLLDANFVESLISEGVFLNDIPGRFNSGFGVQPSEIKPFLESHGFDTITVIASQGLGSGIEDVVASLAENDPAMHSRVMELIIETAPDPALHGLTTHLLYIGSRR